MKRLARVDVASRSKTGTKIIANGIGGQRGFPHASRGCCIGSGFLDKVSVAIE